MNETAGAAPAAGAAHEVSAVAGPPLPDHLMLAAALREASITDGIVARMQRKVDKTRARAEGELEEALAALALAERDAADADARVAELAGEDGGSAALASLKEAAESALAEYEQAAARLGGEG